MAAASKSGPERIEDTRRHTTPLADGGKAETQSSVAVRCPILVWATDLLFLRLGVYLRQLSESEGRGKGFSLASGNMPEGVVAFRCTNERLIYLPIRTGISDKPGISER